MAFGDRPLIRGANGPDVVELQLRLAGFRGTLWDGDYGPGTELQVRTFQRDVMGQSSPSGAVDATTFEALFKFATDHPLDFNAIRCPCGQCQGFGQARFKNEFTPGNPSVEAFHRYEYPGVHKAILHTLRAATFYLTRAQYPKLTVASGYRCWICNEQKGRSSTNHMGKALDFDFPLAAGEDKRDDANRCDKARGLLVELGGFQTGWGANDRKAFEPSNIAPTWIHMDVRCYQKQFLDDKFFVTSNEQLDARV